MHTKLHYFFFLLISVLTVSSCTTDDIVLSVGDDVINDDHNATYFDDFDIECGTMLAEYVLTNNTGVALCGSYNDDYIGEITTNTVFKIAPVYHTVDDKLNIKAVYDSLVLVMIPNGYIYGDSTKDVHFTLHQITDNYEADTLETVIDKGSTVSGKTNNCETPYDATVLADIVFRPEYYTDDTVYTRMPDEIGEKWFNNLVNNNNDYIKDEYFVKNVCNGLTIRGMVGNSAIIGFNMPDNTSSSPDAGIFVRLYYHTVAPYKECYHDFESYEKSLQYNQITADFSTGLLAGIEAGGEAIPSSRTNGLTFIQSGLGLMTKIDIPTLYQLDYLGNNVSIINMALKFSALPRSFVDNYSLPTDMTMERFKKNGEIDADGLLNISGNVETIYNTKSTEYESEYTIPITYYGYVQMQYLETNNEMYRSLLLTARENGNYIPNVNRMVLGDGDNDECEMNVEMYYTTFDN